MTGLNKFIPPMLQREFISGPMDGDKKVSNRGVVYFESSSLTGYSHEYLLNEEKDVWEWMGLVPTPIGTVEFPLRIGERS